MEWITPKLHESIENYALRLSKEIKEPDPIIIGLSFGGIMAVEIARQIKTRKLILIASAKSKNEIPFYLKFIGRLNLQQFIPIRLLKSANVITYFFFGATTSENKALLRQILKDTDPIFLKWAINAVLKWKNEEYVQDVTHLHVNKNRILPSNFVKVDIVIDGGGHLMTLDKFNLINREIERILHSDFVN